MLTYFSIVQWRYIQKKSQNIFYYFVKKKKKKGIYVIQIFVNISTYIYMILTIIYHNS